MRTEQLRRSPADGATMEQMAQFFKVLGDSTRVRLRCGLQTPNSVSVSWQRGWGCQDPQFPTICGCCGSTGWQNAAAAENRSTIPFPMSMSAPRWSWWRSIYWSGRAANSSTPSRNDPCWVSAFALHMTLPQIIFKENFL